jgi:hypothetical protein
MHPTLWLLETLLGMSQVRVLSVTSCSGFEVHLIAHWVSDP